ncbi:uncharacterized protein (TIGR00369 family) [Mycolicibacterium iranicum]|uniref:Uncharacterized protein (TIGR00369 family) n=1 Tax=Mycolicibacterium iranicum TaxID=912594 RepID=A0A839QCX1_MYCIR|nr:uncharacterized protein (TIGR00369 family) [Mycolicibacterium iranicum]
MSEPATALPVLDFLKHRLTGAPPPVPRVHLRYPTAISQSLGFRIVAVDAGTASVAVDVDPDRHGNQQGTVHGGFLVELADAAIGTAHSTLMQDGESFTSIDIRAAFLRPVWADTLTATAHAVHSGRTITHYSCDVVRADGKVAASVTSTVMTLRGDAARGR